MRLYIIRHGDPDYKNDSLTSRGKAEAQALPEYLPRLHLTHLYTSPLGRAKSTCAPCAERLGLPVEELPWVRELTGVYYEIEGIGKCAPFVLPGEVLYGISPTPRYHGWEQQMYFSDSRFISLIHEMEQGSDALLARHGYVHEGACYRVASSSQDRIAIFCHQGIGTTWLSYLLHLPYQAGWAGMWQACTAISEITLEQRSPQWAVPRLLQMGATPHLTLAGLPPMERGLDSVTRN